VASTGPIERPPHLPKLSTGWARLCADTGLQGRDWSMAARELADDWLRQAFDWAVAEAGPVRTRNGPAAGSRPQERRAGAFGGFLGRRERAGVEDPAKGLVLVAVGSLGRDDLAPGSDLDLLLLHDGRPYVGQVADRLWYPIWDDPMPLDHSVRTLSQVGQAAESDLRVAQGLVDARPIAGDMELGSRAIALGQRLWEKRVATWLPAVLDARARAQDAHGDVAFLLEPDLKESRGGERDLQVLSLIATVTPVAAMVTGDERLKAATEFLHAVRVELQRPDARRSERLLFEDQDRVAEALGLAGREELAHEVAHAGRVVSWLTEDAWRRVRSWLAGPRGRAGSADRAIGPGLVQRDNEVVIPLGTAIAEDPSLALRAAIASAELGLPLSRATMSRLAEAAPTPPVPWPEEVMRPFVSLLSLGPPAIHPVETLDQLGVWERYMPEWAAVRNRPQFNPYHRWSVDRHLLETVAHAADHLRDVRRPDLLVLGALMHDIGKGPGGDHSELGAPIAAAAAERMGLSADDAVTLEKLVRYHLLLPDIATRRDLEDPVTLKLVAETVGDEGTLELLRALAAADGEATGSAAWIPWKAGLVNELAERSGALLAGRPVPPGPPFPSVEHRRLMEPGGLHVLPGEHELVVVAPDRPGLFSDVAGVLALHGIGVLQARAHSEDGKALEVFTLDLPENADPRWERVVRDIEGAAGQRLDVGEALARRPPPRKAKKLLAWPGPAMLVLIDNEAATGATVVEVRAPDAPGLLHLVTAAIAALGLDIVSARVATLGTAAVDSFYVRAGAADSADGAKVPPGAPTERLRRAIEEAVAAGAATVQ
jgi:[protein-PII] uridylyltransferase